MGGGEGRGEGARRGKGEGALLPAGRAGGTHQGVLRDFVFYFRKGRSLFVPFIHLMYKRTFNV